MLAAAALASCGGDDGKSDLLAWDGNPRLTITPRGDRIVIGQVRNQSDEVIRLLAPQVKVLDQEGRRLKSAAVFISSYVRSNYPHNGLPISNPEDYPVQEQRRVGYLTGLGPGETSPLTVSWHQPPGRKAQRVSYGRGYLRVPESGETVQPAR